MNARDKLPLLVLLGPTAIGKTQLALEISEDFPDLEVISADSRQIFRFMNIGTAKPTEEELQRLPHHFVDIRNPDESYDAGHFGIEGREVAQKLINQKKLPFVVGGSGLYLRSLVDGLFQGRVSDPDIKRQLQARADREGLESLWQELSKMDPETAQKIHPNDRQRIVRALEVITITGEPVSSLRKKKHPSIPFKPVIYGLRMEREALYQRINSRVDRMIASGLVDEVEWLRNQGYLPHLQSQKTVGYQEIHAYLDGMISIEEAIFLIKRNTRRFAKRQLTWFRPDERIRWLPVNHAQDWQKAVQEVQVQLKQINEEYYSRRS